MTEHTETPAATLDAATDRDALPDAWVTLLGTLHGPDHSRALLRIGGTVHTVEIGTTLGGAMVAAIGEGTVILTRAGRRERLRLPAS
ncbi:type II secretion system protein N [Roseovarius sp.]|uniref:type II secretion system protein N n=1 Tax=Roseovarius sp. TaxID=1486281 RepID=UPI003A969807